MTVGEGLLVVEEPPPRRHTKAIPLSPQSGALTADTVLFTGITHWRGYSVRENTGSAAARVEIFDGHDNTGTLIGAICLAQGTSDHQNFGDDGVYCRQGIFVNVITGSVRGAFYIKD